jgi:hypothetical protein
MPDVRPEPRGRAAGLKGATMATADLEIGGAITPEGFEELLIAAVEACLPCNGDEPDREISGTALRDWYRSELAPEHPSSPDQSSIRFSTWEADDEIESDGAPILDACRRLGLTWSIVQPHRINQRYGEWDTGYVRVGGPGAPTPDFTYLTPDMEPCIAAVGAPEDPLELAAAVRAALAVDRAQVPPLTWRLPG